VSILGDVGKGNVWDTGVGGGGEERCENASDTGVAGGGEERGGNGKMAVGGGGTLYIWLCSFPELLMILKCK